MKINILKNKVIYAVMACLYLALILAFAACNGSGTDHKKDGPAAGGTYEVPKAGEKQCYNYFENGDTIILTLKWLDANKFTGSMVYRLREKDGNIGTLEGQRRDAVLLADYQFNSEGMTSVREVAFKKVEDYIVEGFGDVTPDSSGFRFTNPDSLQFDLHRKLHEVKCL